MAEFKVSEVIDGYTFKVQNGWKWNNKTSDTVMFCSRVYTFH